MPHLHSTEKLLGLKDVTIKNVEDNEEKIEVFLEKPKKNLIYVPNAVKRQLRYMATEISKLGISRRLVSNFEIVSFTFFKISIQKRWRLLNTIAISLQFHFRVPPQHLTKN